MPNTSIVQASYGIFDPRAFLGRTGLGKTVERYAKNQKIFGQGDVADTGKVLEVHYSGWLANGVKFDSSIEDRPFTFRLGAGDAIKGWDEGLMGMKVGGKRRLVIPPELGFGKQGVGSVVPPNAVLVYEFELLAVR